MAYSTIVTKDEGAVIIVDNIAYFNAYYKHQKSYSMFKIK